MFCLIEFRCLSCLALPCVNAKPPPPLSSPATPLHVPIDDSHLRLLSVTHATRKRADRLTYPEAKARQLWCNNPDRQPSPTRTLAHPLSPCPLPPCPVLGDYLAACTLIDRLPPAHTMRWTTASRHQTNEDEAAVGEGEAHRRDATKDLDHRVRRAVCYSNIGFISFPRNQRRDSRPCIAFPVADQGPGSVSSSAV